MAQITTSLEGFTHSESQLLKIPIEMDNQARKALRRMGTLVANRAKQLVPPPGYPGDKPGFKALRDTLGVEVKQGRVLMSITGPKRPAGAHGHLVEYAHRHMSHGELTGTITEPHPFLGPAATETKVQQDQIARNAVVEMDRNIG